MKHSTRHAHALHGGMTQDLRRHATAAVLFHNALAETMGLGSNDLQCLDLLIEHGHASASDLAALTGLTSGALTGVVSRLESAELLERHPDSTDGRRQLLRARHDRMHAIAQRFEALHGETDRMLTEFSAAERAVIARFLRRCTDLLYRQIGGLRTAVAPRDHAPPSKGRARTVKGRTP